jgi:hypothetical protein
LVYWIFAIQYWHCRKEQPFGPVWVQALAGMGRVNASVVRSFRWFPGRLGGEGPERAVVDEDLIFGKTGIRVNRDFLD